jgi:phenylalanyl-tRNA synthetase beta chain
MKVSLNTIKQYTDVDLSVDELVKKINEQLGGVEEVTDLGKRYEGATIVKVVSCGDHPNADKLHVCKIDDGGVVKDVERDEKGYVQVVCGAPNVREGLHVVWLPPGSTVPTSFADKEPFVLSARELRGVVSQGMLASPKELGFGDSHDGILEIDPSEWKPNDTEIKPGTSFAEAFGLDDTIIDIENKMFTHRPDCFGQLGVAREIAGIQHKAFTSPKWYSQLPEFNSGDGLDLTVKNDAGAAVPRFMAVAMRGISVKPSPVWLQAELVRLGSKPINNIVDVTNYVMLLTGQPLHAYDYDKLRGHELGTRMAKKGEKITLLNGKTYQLDLSDIVITDGEGPVGLGGVMGGGNSEVSSKTKNIVLECATFDMYAIRKTSMRHGLFTDAVTRFNKGQSPLQNDYILSLAVMSVTDVSSGEIASQHFDARGTDEKALRRSVTVTPEFINDRLGLKLSAKEISRLLENVEFTISEISKGKTKSLKVNVPFWRTDIELPEDVVEEVGRLYGFDKLPRVLPARTTKPAPRNERLELKQRIRESLSRAGGNDVLTYSFVHENVMKRAEQDPAHAYQLSNALSPDLHYYRTALLPSLLDKVHMNIKAGHDGFAIFELNKVHYKGEMDPDEPGVPNEDDHVALVLAYTDKHKPDSAPYYHARKYLAQIVDVESLDLIPLAKFDLSTDEWGRQLTAPYDPDRSAVIVRDSQIWGVIGEFKQSVLQAFKLPRFTAGFEVHLDVLTGTQPSYVPLSKFPSVTQDISLKVTQDISYSQLVRLAREAADLASEGMMTSLRPLTIYQPEGGDTKTITLRFTVAHYEKTLTDKDVTALLDHVAAAASKAIHAQRI